jgi:hypothetical protein
LGTKLPEDRPLLGTEPTPLLSVDCACKLGGPLQDAGYPRRGDPARPQLDEAAEEDQRRGMPACGLRDRCCNIRPHRRGAILNECSGFRVLKQPEGRHVERTGERPAVADEPVARAGSARANQQHVRTRAHEIGEPRHQLLALERELVEIVDKKNGGRSAVPP